MNNLIQNGDFSASGQHWSGPHISYSDGKAHISNSGYIEQEINISSTIPAGTVLNISFDLSGMYGSTVNVYINTQFYPAISKEGHHDISLVVANDSDTLTLRFQASNAFSLDNVSLAIAECELVDLIKNGDFAASDKHWSGSHVIYSSGKANVSNSGYIEQEITLPSAIKAGSIVNVIFDLSGMYGSTVNVYINTQFYPTIREEGHHEIGIVIAKDSDTLKLRFQGSNAFSLDNVKLFTCSLG